MYCLHENTYHGICLNCGDIVGDNPNSTPINTSQSINFDEFDFDTFIKDNLKSFKAKKVLTAIIKLESILVTVYHPQSDEELEKIKGKDVGDIIITKDSESTVVIKLRPNASHFLSSLHSLFEFSIVSNLNPNIIDVIMKVLDPDQSLINNRVFQFDSILLDNNTFQYCLFPAGQKVSLILDSSSKIWHKMARQEINGFNYVCPYNYFSNTENINISEFISLPNLSRNDTVLYGLEQFLRNVHFYFYEKQVNSIAASLDFSQRSILSDCILCSSTFSKEVTDLLESLTFRFGGRFYYIYNSTVTHLIVKDSNDPNIKEAQKYNGVKIISIQWIIDVGTQYRKLDELLYQVPNLPSVTSGDLKIEVPSLSSDLSSTEFDNICEDDIDSDEESESSNYDEILKKITLEDLK